MTEWNHEYQLKVLCPLERCVEADNARIRLENYFLIKTFSRYPAGFTVALENVLLDEAKEEKDFN